MSRDITSAVLNALDDAVIEPFFAVDLDFDSGSLYLWSGYGDLVIGSKTYRWCWSITKHIFCV